MTTTIELPKTLIEAVLYFSDIDRCNEYMKSIKWPDGKITCPKCGCERIGEIKTRKMLRCKDCRKQFSYKVGTIFEDSPIGLDRWFVAVWCITNAKNGISSYELSRAIGVTQKSAWHMLHRIRLAMQQKTFKKIVGEIESDESFIGGKKKNMHKHKRDQMPKGRGTVGKTIVHGVLQRTKGDQASEVRATVVPNQKRRTLQYEIKKNVKKGEIVYTDALPSYEGLDSDYIHHTIDHAVSYVEGAIHTNGVENFWSLLKRCLGGTYVAVAPKHLGRYVDEEVFRFNKRKGTDATRFQNSMKGVIGKKLPYQELTGAEA